MPKLSCSCVAIRAHLLITSLHTTERGFTLPDSHLSSVTSGISLWFDWSVLHNLGHGFIITSLENSSTYNCSSGATTKRIMLPLFSVRIPVPVLFSVGQSKQCDTAMGGCSHYLCSIKFLRTCQVPKIFFQQSSIFSVGFCKLKIKSLQVLVGSNEDYMKELSCSFILKIMHM